MLGFVSGWASKASQVGEQTKRELTASEHGIRGKVPLDRLQFDGERQTSFADEPLEVLLDRSQSMATLIVLCS